MNVALASRAWSAALRRVVELRTQLANTPESGRAEAARLLTQAELDLEVRARELLETRKGGPLLGDAE